MKIQCDVCEKAAATVICCADEAALCGKCDVEVHAANKLASKHQRLLLESLSNKLPRCDICQEKAAFIFCVEDRALFCKDCDESVHLAGSMSAKHQRFLATGIRVALNSSCNDAEKSCCPEPPNPSSKTVSVKAPPQQSPSFASSWAVDDLLQFSDFQSSTDKKEQLEFGEFEWLTNISMFGEDFGQVPELPVSQSSNAPSHGSSKSGMAFKKPRIEQVEDLDEYFTVPDLG